MTPTTTQAQTQLDEILAEVDRAVPIVVKVVQSSPGMLPGELIEKVRSEHEDLKESVIREAIWQALSNGDLVLENDRRIKHAA